MEIGKIVKPKNEILINLDNIKMDKKKILLVSPSMEPDKKYPKGLRIPEIALSIIAANTPEHYDVEIIEEEIDTVDFNVDCDLVGITSSTPTAFRAYELGREFKKRGKKVVYGGIHPTVLPDEALQYGDSVVIGEAEGAWQELLEDFENGGLKPKYHILQPDLSDYNPPKRKPPKDKSLFNALPIVTTRGCPYDCDFCCVPEFFGPKLRHVPIEKVCKDIESSNGKIFIFLDDNIIGHPKYAKALFRAIAPYKIKWVGQASISFVKDLELMKLAKESGCGALFFGVESVSTNQLETMRKTIKEIDKVEEAIKRVKDLGIHFHASMILGFDTDTEAIFDDTFEFLMRNKIGTATFNILTPYPGTRVYNRLKEENRILTNDWKYYDHCTVVFQPKNMSLMQLTEGYLRLKSEFYKVGNILKRLPWNLSHPLLNLAMSFSFRSSVKSQKTHFAERLNTLLAEAKIETS